MSHALVLVLDFGSQYTQLIVRRVRELGFYSEVIPGDSALSEITGKNPKAIILSGGPSSVYEEGAPQLAPGFWNYQKENQLPLLGICYGLQLIAHENKGSVKAAAKREYGRMGVSFQKQSPLLKDVPENFNAWMSHGDEVSELPQGFEVMAQSVAGAVAIIENKSARLFGLQFHPEVVHTENGALLLSNFLKNCAGLSPDWNMSLYVDEEVEHLKKIIPPNAQVICALSGGVDSTVAATLVQRAIGDRLHCVFVDHGLLRLDEQKKVMDLFSQKLNLQVECVDAEERFLTALSGVSDPEQKRKIIGKEFIEVFREFSKKLAEKHGISLSSQKMFLVQGTLYPDVIESSPAVHQEGSQSFKHSKTIKSHHNVGGLPKDLPFQLLEPLRSLFKDEVRKLGRELGIPNEFLARHPFPGPGLAVRVIGDLTPEKLKILKEADAVFIQALHEFGIYDDIWQAFAVFLPIRTVGVQGDGRTHDYVIALRAVTSVDGMTADWYPFEHKTLAEISSRICNQVRGVNRVVYDISSKPPATIEWE